MTTAEGTENEMTSQLASQILTEMNVHNVRVEDLDVGDQPRKHFDEKDAEDLKQSIAAIGLINPIIVSRVGGDRYKVVCGERRVNAHKALNREKIPAIILENNKVDEVALIDNVQRVDLHAVELAESVDQLIKKYDYSQEQMGRLLGKAESTISEIRSLCKLSESIRNDARTRKELSRAALLKVAIKEGPKTQQKAYDALIASLAVKSKDGMRPRRPKSECTLNHIDKAIQFVNTLDIVNVGNERANVEEKLHQLLKEIQNKLVSLGG